MFWIFNELIQIFSFDYELELDLVIIMVFDKFIVSGSE